MRHPAPKGPSKPDDLIILTTNLTERSVTMANRKPILNRPWLNSSKIDLFSRSTILHVDAYVETLDALNVLRIDYREGGRRQVAHEAYRIDPDGLVEAWDVDAWVARGPLRTYWSRINNPWMARVHQTVLAKARGVEGFQWPRVSLQCHYVLATDTDGEIPPARNFYKPPQPYTRRKLPDWL